MAGTGTVADAAGLADALGHRAGRRLVLAAPPGAIPGSNTKGGPCDPCTDPALLQIGHFP